jgi:hypothetical protein
LDGVGGSAPRELEVIVALDNKCQAGGAKVRRSRTLLPSHVSKVRGPPRTNLARTLIDLSEQLDFEDLELAFGSAQRQQRDFREWLRRVMKPIPRRGHRGIANLDVLLEERDVAVDSALEVRVRRLLKSARLPMPVTGHPVFDDQVHVVRLDFAWPNNKPRVGLMAHGARWHNDTKRWKRDLKQVSRLSGMGWRVVQCTYDDVTKDSEQLLVDLRRALGGVVASGEHGEDVPI